VAPWPTWRAAAILGGWLPRDERFKRRRTGDHRAGHIQTPGYFLILSGFVWLLFLCRG